MFPGNLTCMPMPLMLFDINWNNGFYYGFPPFSVIGKVLRKIVKERATTLLVLPLWPTRVWFPRALRLLAATPRILPTQCLTLPQDPTQHHPL